MKIVDNRTEINVTGVAIPFWDLVWFIFKFTLAGLPAALLILVASALFMGFFRAVFGG